MTLSWSFGGSDKDIQITSEMRNYCKAARYRYNLRMEEKRLQCNKKAEEDQRCHKKKTSIMLGQRNCVWKMMWSNSKRRPIISQYWEKSEAIGRKSPDQTHPEKIIEHKDRISSLSEEIFILKKEKNMDTLWLTDLFWKSLPIYVTFYI